MLKKLKVLSLSLIFVLFTNLIFAADTPVIVIAPSKKAQSKSIVGTSVVVYDEEDIENSNEFFFRVNKPRMNTSSTESSKHRKC